MSYAARQTRNVPGPSALMVETTIRCNLQCPMCPRTGAGYPNEDMPDDMLYALLDDHARMGGDHVYLYGLGEPLMDSRIFDIVKYCKSRNLGTILSTNGTFLTSQRRQQLLESGCDHLLVGLDGASKATYDHYRVGGKYDKVVANLRALASENAALDNPLYIVVQFIRMKENWHEQDAFHSQWSNTPGIQEVRIKEEDIGLEDHRTFEVDGAQRKNPCHTLWRGPVVVRWNGDVFPCYPFAGANECIGNLRESSLEALWDGPELQHLRELHTSGRTDQNAHCSTCPAMRPRLPVVLGAMALRGTTVRQLVPIAERIAQRSPISFHGKPKTDGLVGVLRARRNAVVNYAAIALTVERA